jgi:hypothetical protein
MGANYGIGLINTMIDYCWKNDCPGNPNLYSHKVGRNVDVSVEFGDDGHVVRFKMLQRNNEKGFSETVHYIVESEGETYVTRKGTVSEAGEMSPEEVSDFEACFSDALRNMDKTKFCLMDVIFPGSASDRIAKEKMGKLKDAAYRDLRTACDSLA